MIQEKLNNDKNKGSGVAKIKISTDQVPMYDKLPKNKIQLDVLEKICFLRMSVIDIIDQKSQIQPETNNNTKGSYDKVVKTLEESPISWTSNNTLINDNISFFIISCLFCNQEAQRLWLANIESKLYVQRLINNEVNKLDLLTRMNIPIEYENISINSDLYKLINFKEKSKSTNDDKTDKKERVIKIPFEYVLNLLPTMKYFIYQGYVYITEAETMNIIENVFKEECLRKYNNISKSVDNVLADPRIKEVVRKLEQQREQNKLGAIVNSSSINSSDVSLRDIEDHAEKHYPLCMTIVHRVLTKEAHLKHNGRMQYGLFLKGLGLSLDESLQLWKSKFQAKKTLDQFDKQYAYNIRHNYGQEGKRTDYPPWSCNKIQNLPPPNSTEMHGCPFKVFSEDKLRNILYEMKFKEGDVVKILDKKKSNEFSVACIRFFESRYPNQEFEKVGIHPNYYFASAAGKLKKRGKENKVQIKEEQVES